MEAKPNVGKFGKKWAKEAAKAADAALRKPEEIDEVRLLEKEERRKRRGLPVEDHRRVFTAHTVEGVSDKYEAGFTGRVTDAGWPEKELVEEATPELTVDYREQAEGLREYVEREQIDVGDIDLFAEGPDLVIEVERAKALLGWVTGERVPGIGKKKIRRAISPVVELKKIIKTKSEVVEATIDPRRLVSEEMKRFLEEEGRLEWLAGLWGDESVRVVLYPRSEGKKPRPAKIRLLRESEGKVDDFQMSISEWEQMLRERKKDEDGAIVENQVRFPRKVNLDAKIDWSLMFRALRLNGTTFGGRFDNIYFSEETREMGSEIHDLITRANEQFRKKK